MDLRLSQVFSLSLWLNHNVFQAVVSQFAFQYVFPRISESSERDKVTILFLV